MSRHRNVRSMNYNDEYDGYDDEYGHSVEDDFCISPSDAAQFMYDRNRQSTQISAFFNESENIAEEDEGENNVVSERKPSDSFQKPRLSELEKGRLQSCLDEIRNVIGDTVPENIIIETILKNSFDLSKSLDAVLSYEPSASAADNPKPQRERKERNRDDDFSDFYASLQSSLNQCRDKRPFSILSNTEAPQLVYPDTSVLLLNHLPGDPDLNMSKNKISSNFLVPFSKSSKEIGSTQSNPQNTQPLILSSTHKVVKEPSSEVVAPTTSNSVNQLKFYVPRLQKPRKDSDKENIADRDESDSEDFLFSSLSALAKQYSSKSVKAPQEKEMNSPETKQLEILDKVPTVLSFSNYNPLKDFGSENTENESLTDTFSSLWSNSFESALAKDSLINKRIADRCSHDEEQSSPLRVEPSLKTETEQLLDRLSTKSGNQSVERQEVSLISTLIEGIREPKLNVKNHQFSPQLERSDENINTLHSSKDPPSLTEIVNEHLHKSVSHSNNLHVTGNFDIMKSESCPQFVIPPLHLSQKRRGVSECMPDESQDEGAICDIMNVAVEDKVNDTDNWVIDLKCALKSIQRESAESKNFNFSKGINSCDLDSSDESLFIADLPCLLDTDFTLEENCRVPTTEPSAFGKVLCRKWKAKLVKNVHHHKELPKTVNRFTFSTPSPDDNIMRYLE